MSSTTARAGTTHTASVVPAAVSDPAALAPDDFKAVFRNHPAGVGVITADDGSGPVAMTASSIFSVSAVPPLLVFSASSLSSSTPVLRNASSVVVHLVADDQLWLAELAATSGVDRFAGVAWSRLPGGEPYYTDAAAWVRGRITATLDAGSATLFVVEATHARVPDPDPAGAPSTARRPLVYHNRTWHALDAASRVAR